MTDYLSSQKCAFDFGCFEGEDCAKQNRPVSGIGDALISQRNYGPGKGTCTVRICASRLTDLTQTLRHELAHCVKFCGGQLNDTCQNELCHEIYAYAADGRCDVHAGDPNKYTECLKSNAKSSADVTGLCKGKDMDAILTKSFVDSCRSGKNGK